MAASDTAKEVADKHGIPLAAAGALVYIIPLAADLTCEYAPIVCEHIPHGQLVAGLTGLGAYLFARMHTVWSERKWWL